MKTQCLKWQLVTMLFENEAVRQICLAAFCFYWEEHNE